MYIEPNSVIKLIRSCPLDPDYIHTLWFASPEEQARTFSSHTTARLTFNNQYYARPERNQIKIQIPYADVYDVNYMMFKNTSFENKWWYAFVTKVEYVSNNVTLFTYEIDMMQSWMDEIEFTPCFIERAHTVTDVIGENTLPEPIGAGDYFYDEISMPLLEFTNYKIVVCATATYETGIDKLTFNFVTGHWRFVINDASNGMVQNVFTGVYYNVFDNMSAADYPLVPTNKLSAAEVAADFLRQLTTENKSDAVVAITMLPANFCNVTESTPWSQTQWMYKPYSGVWDFEPHNKKLYCYPYNCLAVNDLSGNTAEFKYEYFIPDSEHPSSQFAFKLQAVLGCSPEAQLIPINYGGFETGLFENYNHRLVYDSFVKCAYNIDSFLAWLAQNTKKIVIDTAATAANAAIGITNASALSTVSQMTNSPYTGASASRMRVGAIANAVEKVAGTIGDIWTASTMPNQAKGNQGNLINKACGIEGFHFYNAHCRNEIAHIADDFFDRFGYSIKAVQTPNPTARPHWTYIKTTSCDIGGHTPADVTEAINNIMDRGITFWGSYGEVGKYDLDNTPLSAQEVDDG